MPNSKGIRILIVQQDELTRIKLNYITEFGHIQQSGMPVEQSRKLSDSHHRKVLQHQLFIG